MRTEVEHIAHIRTAFSQMQTKRDLLHLLNYAKSLIYGEKAIPFELKQLSWYSEANTSRTRYNSFAIKKKSGGERTIHAPKPGLKAIQRSLALILQCVFQSHDAAMGFVKGRSILDNAKIHQDSNYVYNIDLKDFFPSIDQARVWACLKLRPFLLCPAEKSRTKKNGRLVLAGIIASLCCTELAVERKNSEGNWETVNMNVLPQGAPTSPVLSNVVCQKLDSRLSGVAKRFGLKYSRYADDITFSSSHNVYHPDGEFVKELRRIIEDQRFYIKEEKTRLQEKSYRQMVTGLVVNEKANVPRQYVKQVRMWLYYLEHYGFLKASAFFRKKHITASGPAKTEPDMIKMLAGKLEYLSMVRGNTDKTYTALLNKFDLLTGKPTDKKPNTQKASRSKLPVIHSPQALISYLKNFSTNGKPLKFTTHSWDEGRKDYMFKSLHEFLRLAQQQYNSFSFKLKDLSDSLNGKLYGFLFNKDVSNAGWGVQRIRFGWSSPELLKACTEDPMLNPEDFVIPVDYQCLVEGKTIQKFKQVIDIFKNEIEIRDENSTLEKLILAKHTKYLAGFADPKLTNLDNKTFYTDVQWLSSALDRIFESIQNRRQFSEVEYSVVQEQPNAYILEILHKDSFNSGKSFKDEKLNLTKGDFSEIQKRLRNLCDWSIESQFSEGPYRINYLSSDLKTPQFEEIEKAEGFKHRLTFYK
jgi:RNA-directed DNA polymerase